MVEFQSWVARVCSQEMKAGVGEAGGRGREAKTTATETSTAMSGTEDMRWEANHRWASLTQPDQAGRLESMEANQLEISDRLDLD